MPAITAHADATAITRSVLEKISDFQNTSPSAPSQANEKTMPVRKAPAKFSCLAGFSGAAIQCEKYPNCLYAVRRQAPTNGYKMALESRLFTSDLTLEISGLRGFSRRSGGLTG